MAVQALTKINELRTLYLEFRPDVTDEMKT